MAVTPTTTREINDGLGSSTRPKVAVVYATPETVLDDVARAMALADYSRHPPNGPATSLKINISWQHYYPA